MNSGEHSSINSGMQGFHWNGKQPEWQYWQSPLPISIPPECTGFHWNHWNPAGIYGALIRSSDLSPSQSDSDSVFVIKPLSAYVHIFRSLTPALTAQVAGGFPDWLKYRLASMEQRQANLEANIKQGQVKIKQMLANLQANIEWMQLTCNEMQMATQGKVDSIEDLLQSWMASRNGPDIDNDCEDGL